jgi:hypothetical protein
MTQVTQVIMRRIWGVAMILLRIPALLLAKRISEIDFNEDDVTGSVDLHIGASSVCLEAGVDLGTINGVNIDIDGVDRDATGVTWDIGADQKSVATSTGSPAFMLFMD